MPQLASARSQHALGSQQASAPDTRPVHVARYARRSQPSPAAGPRSTQRAQQPASPRSHQTQRAGTRPYQMELELAPVTKVAPLYVIYSLIPLFFVFVTTHG